MKNRLKLPRWMAVLTALSAPAAAEVAVGQINPAAPSRPDAASATTPLSEHDLSGMRQDWGKPRRNASVGGAALQVGGVVYATGIGTHAESSWRLELDGKGVEFQAKAGVQDGARAAEFVVWGDDKVLFRSGPMKGGEPAREIRVPLAGVHDLELAVEAVGGIDAAHANWIEPVVVHQGASLAVSTRPHKNRKWPNLEEVVVCWKSHCDIGYTHPVPDVLHGYRTGMMDRALALMEQSEALPPEQRFRWLLPAWVMELVLDDQQEPARRARIEQFVRNQRMQFHALPFTIETEASDLEEMVRGLGCASRISRRMGLPLPTDGKLTDMPSQAWGLPVVLNHAGVKFVHIGVNPWSPNPQVPLLFWWEGPDGSRVLVGYGFHNYSWPLIPPKGWPHKTWLAFQVQGDNSPPPGPQQVQQALDHLRRELPGVRVRFGRPSDFADAIIKENADLPVVRGNMPDTWTHGQMAMPVATQTHRRATMALASLGVLDTGLRGWGVPTGDVAPLLAIGYDRAALFTEHTWGIYGPAFGTPDRESWRRNLESGKYDRQLATFDYKAEYARKAWAVATDGIASRVAALARAVDHSGPRVVAFNPLPWKRDAVVETSAGSLLVRDVPPCGYKTFPAGEPAPPRVLPGDSVETGHFKVKFDTRRGGIASLIGKGDGRELADTRTHALGQFIHERFSKANVDGFLKAYCHVYYDWHGFPYYDFNKPRLDPGLPYLAVSPRDWVLRLEREAAGDRATLTSTNTSGLADAYRLVFFFPNHQPSVDITWSVENKKPDLVPEGGWICLPLAVKQPVFRVSQTGAPFNPAEDVVPGSNRHLFSIDHGISIRAGSDGPGVGVASNDLPLWSTGEPGLWKFTADYVATNAVLYANLYNNQWNTNYPLWVDGSWSATLRLWPVSRGASEEAALFTPAWELRQPMLTGFAAGPAGPLPPTQEGLALSRRGVRVSAYCPNPDGPGTVLRVWEQAGESGEVVVTGLNARTATPVNLRGERTAPPIPIESHRLTLTLKAYAPCTHILED